MKNKYLIIIYLFVILMLYETLNFNGVTYTKILFGVSFFYFLYLFRTKKNELKEIRSQKRFSFDFMIGLLIFTVVVSSASLFSIESYRQINSTNIYEAMRNVLYILIFINMSLLISDKDDISNGKKYLIIFIIINCIVGITQFYNLFNLNELYIKTIAPTQYVTLINNYPNPRVVGLTGNPNVFGYLLMLTIILILSEIKVNPYRIKYYLISLLLHITLFMTRSRTAFIALILGELLFVFFSLINFKNLKNSLAKIIKYCLITLLIEIGLVFILPNNLTWRYKELVHFNKIHSWQMRVKDINNYIYDIWNDIINKKDQQSNNPIDSEKDSQSNNPIDSEKDKTLEIEMYDNEYAFILFKYGIIGLVAYLAMFIYPMLNNKNYQPQKKALFFAITLSTLIYIFPAGIYNSAKLFGFLFIVYSLIDNKNEKEAKNKNILVIATYFPPSGGVGVFRITKFVKYLQKFNYNVSIVTVSDKFNVNRDDALTKNIISGTKIYRLEFINHKESRLSINFYFALRKKIKKIIGESKPSLILLTGGPFYILPIGRHIKNKFGIPYIIDLRDPWSSQKKMNSNIKSKSRYYIDRLLESYTFNQSSAIITVNDTMTNELRIKYPKLKNKVFSITNGFDPDDFKDIIPKKFRIFTIIYTGKFSVSAGFRNPENLFSAMKSLIEKDYDIRFIHIGQKEDIIIKLACKVGIYKNCQFLGFMPYQKTLEYCKGADILVVLSGNEKSEQTGKIFDYIGCCKPILAITNKNNELYKICKKSKLVYQVNPNSLKEIENTIKKIYDNKKKEVLINEDIKLTREYLTKKLDRVINKIDY